MAVRQLRLASCMPAVIWHLTLYMDIRMKLKMLLTLTAMTFTMWMNMVNQQAISLNSVFLTELAKLVLEQLLIGILVSTSSLQHRLVRYLVVDMVLEQR